jgi:hypothetical protein
LARIYSTIWVPGSGSAIVGHWSRLARYTPLISVYRKIRAHHRINRVIKIGFHPPSANRTGLDPTVSNTPERKDTPLTERDGQGD